MSVQVHKENMAKPNGEGQPPAPPALPKSEGEQPLANASSEGGEESGEEGEPPKDKPPGEGSPSGDDPPVELQQQVTELTEQVATLTKERDQAVTERDEAVAAKEEAVTAKEAAVAELDKVKEMMASSLEADKALLTEQQRAELEKIEDPLEQHRRIEFLRSMGMMPTGPAPAGKVYEGLSGSGGSGAPKRPRSVKEASKAVSQQVKNKRKGK